MQLEIPNHLSQVLHSLVPSYLKAATYPNLTLIEIKNRYLVTLRSYITLKVTLQVQKMIDM